MAFFTILRRSASLRLPLMTRAIGTPRKYHSAILTPLKNTTLSCPRELFRPVCNFSSLTKKSQTEKKLLKAITSEMESSEQKEVAASAEDFPFLIDNQQGSETISLSRKYKGELIEVKVHFPEPIESNTSSSESDTSSSSDDDTSSSSDETSSDDTSSDEESKTECKHSFELEVHITKAAGGPWLEFELTAYPEEIVIDSLAVKDGSKCCNDEYEGPDFTELDEKLVKCLDSYLRDRGIEPSTTKYLHKYMRNKQRKEYRLWLKNLKSFVDM